MTKELSRRFAKAIQKINFFTMLDRFVFIDRITKVDKFSDLSEDDQEMILEAERL